MSAPLSALVQTWKDLRAAPRRGDKRDRLGLLFSTLDTPDLVLAAHYLSGDLAREAPGVGRGRGDPVPGRGLPALLDLRGRPDLYGRALRTSETGFADEIAAAASLLMGQADEALPMVLLRGLRWSATSSPAANLLRDPAQDLFR